MRGNLIFCASFRAGFALTWAVPSPYLARSPSVKLRRGYERGTRKVRRRYDRVTVKKRSEISLHPAGILLFLHLFSRELRGSLLIFRYLYQILLSLFLSNMNKREFIKSAAVIAGAAVATPLSSSIATSASAPVAGTKANVNKTQKVTLKKSLGFGMINEELSLTDKFKLVLDLGYHGVELNTPVDIPLQEILEAKEKSGIELPTVVNKDHWSFPLSDANPEVREKCIESVAQSLREVKAMGGDTVLVVPGVVNDRMSYEQAYINSQQSIRELIPYAEETGMQIGLENVWNNFLISPVEAKRYIDEINHPLVGWYFDVGNILRYGWPEHWIRTLNKRIMKLHIKEFSRERMNTMGLGQGFNVELLEGDNNWPVVMEAIRDIQHEGGWLTAEVSGGDRNHLQKISTQMDQIIAYL